MLIPTIETLEPAVQSGAIKHHHFQVATPHLTRKASLTQWAHAQVSSLYKSSQQYHMDRLISTVKEPLVHGLTLCNSMLAGSPGSPISIQRGNMFRSVLLLTSPI